MSATQPGPNQQVVESVTELIRSKFYNYRQQALAESAAMKRSASGLEIAKPVFLTKGLFSWQNFQRNVTVAVSLLFGKYCLIMV
jgi:hypothetical protein